MTKQETDDHNMACLHAYMVKTGVKPEDFDTLPFGEEAEWSHTKEAATAYLQSVGLTFEGFLDFMYTRWTPDNVAGNEASYKASDLRQYIREHNTL